MTLLLAPSLPFYPRVAIIWVISGTVEWPTWRGGSTRHLWTHCSVFSISGPPPAWREAHSSADHGVLFHLFTGIPAFLWLLYCLPLAHAFSVSTVTPSSHFPWRSQFIKIIASTIKEGSQFTRLQRDLSFFFSPSLCMSTRNLAHLSLPPTSAWGPILSWLFRNLV